jgi:hypothetical protein
MKVFVAELFAAAALATATAVSAEVDADAVSLLQRMREMLDQQAAAFELRLEQQAAAHKQEVAALREAIRESVSSSERAGDGASRRFLKDINLDDFAGVIIVKPNAGVMLGQDRDVALLRTGT